MEKCKFPYCFWRRIVVIFRHYDGQALTPYFLRDKLPHVKIVGFSTLSVDKGDLVSPTIGFDAVLTRQDGLSKLVETLKALLPKAP